MNWDSRFASIVKETEQNLAKVKSQLRSPLTLRRSGVTPPSYANLVDSPMSPHITPGILKETRGREAHRRRSVSFDLGSSAGGQGSITQGGGAVMSLLTTRIKDQQKEILSLQESLASLQRSLQQQERQVQSVNVELKKLQSNRPTSTVTDTQFQQFKLQVRREMDDFKSRLSSSHWSNSPGSHSVQAIAQELHTSKRLLRGDIESMQEDISSLKSKLRSYESDIGLVGTSVRDMERKQDRLQKTVSGLLEWRQGEEVGRSRHTSSVQDHNSQLQRTKQLMSDLQSRLSLLEHKSFLGPQQRDSTLLTADLDPPSQATNLSSSYPLSTGTKSHSSSARNLFSSSARGSGNNNSPRPSSSVRSPHGLSSLSRDYSYKRPSTSRRNPLHTTSPLWGQSSRGGVSDDEDTLDGLSVLSSESGAGLELDHDLSYDYDLSPSTSILDVGSL
ncbi:uncharacterized protein LOC135334930 [Halichondria panicea]|uniref:uncharacterized protein LOC135334930 n=1 Tax=Halichondria panicea TaxID=6063 RepID=UPI00312B3270